MLDDKDLEFVGILRSLNVPRNVATLITYLANTDEVTSREIERGTNLRQPEVSTGMRTLRQNNWVEERDIKSKEKRAAHQGLQAWRAYWRDHKTL